MIAARLVYRFPVSQELDDKKVAEIEQYLNSRWEGVKEQVMAHMRREINAMYGIAPADDMTAG